MCPLKTIISVFRFGFGVWKNSLNYRKKKEIKTQMKNKDINYVIVITLNDYLLTYTSYIHMYMRTTIFFKYSMKKIIF